METNKTIAIFFILCIGLANPAKEDDCGWGWKDLAYMGVGAGVAIAAAPLAVGAAGFGAGGIAAGSLAAKGMSLAATTGVGGGAIATLQSIGAAGLGYFGATVAGAAGAAGAAGGKYAKDKYSKRNEEG